jgi:16S rRNA (uracil1498-N3)-methyltransferase
LHRFYAVSLDENRTAFLAPEDARHAATVLRLKPEDEVEIIWDHHRYAACLTACTPKEASAVLVRQLPDTEPRLRLTLFQGLPKADKMDMMEQKAVELGVHRVVPVLMERSIVRPDEAGMRKKQERWQKIAREACKQSGRVREVPVDLPLAFPAFLESLAAEEAVLVPWEEARSAGPLAFARAHPHPEKISILIGPEGGITPEEIAALPSAFQPLTLGPRILRTETAGLACVSALLALYGEME